jgi:hypothetical protein
MTGQGVREHDGGIGLVVDAGAESGDQLAGAQFGVDDLLVAAEEVGRCSRRCRSRWLS